MADCNEYLELISRSVDGDLTSEEAEQLYEHLAHCPSCSETLSTFEELSMMTADSMKKPPAQLRDGVMASIRASKNRPWYVKYRFTAVAACFALVIFAMSYTPLGDLFSPVQEDLTEQTADVDSSPGTAMRAMPDTEIKAEPRTAMKPAEPMTADATPHETVSENDAVAVAEEAPSEEAAQEPVQEVDPLLLPHTPYESTFSKYLMFSAKEAPAVLYEITSDQTVEHTVYYIVTAEQFTAVQSALLEDGVEVQVIPGDPESEQSLLILTIKE